MFLSFLCAAVRIYDDAGVSPQCHTQAVLMCQSLGLEWKSISADQVIKTNWEDVAQIFIMPGGADCPYAKLLNGPGCSRIKNFVCSGGLYVGFCAGSYFGGSEIEFDESNGQKIKAKRELAFFKGLVKGPVYGPYFPESDIGVRAALIDGVHFYYDGGGCFVDADKKENVEIIKRYANGEAAAVRCKAGKGQAVLIGFHPEFNPKCLDQNDRYLEDIVPVLMADDPKRELFLLEVFGEYMPGWLYWYKYFRSQVC